MSEVKAALWGAAGVCLGSLITGVVTYFVAEAQISSQIKISQEQSQAQLRALYSANNFAVAQALRGRSEDFIKATRKYLDSYRAPRSAADRDKFEAELSDDVADVIAAASAVIPYLDYFDGTEVESFMKALGEMAREIDKQGKYSEESIDRVSCGFVKVGFLINKRLADLDYKTMPDQKAEENQQAFVLAGLPKCGK